MNVVIRLPMLLDINCVVNISDSTCKWTKRQCITSSGLIAGGRRVHFIII